MDVVGLDSFLSGVVAGYGIAIPVGAIATYLVALSARTSFRVGGAAGLGAATADGVYAAVAVLGGAALAGLVESASTALDWASFVVLVLLAARIAVQGVREYHDPGRDTAPGPDVMRPGRAYLVVLGATMLNPTTVVYFAALVVGGRAEDLGGAAGALFVVGAFLASASWQLLLAGSGAALGRLLTSPAGRLATALISAGLIVALAVRTLES